LFLLRHQLRWMLANGGLDWAASRCDQSAEILYGWAEASAYATPFVAKPDDRSHVVGTIDLDDAVPHETVCAVLRANGIVDTEPYRKLGPPKSSSAQSAEPRPSRCSGERWNFL
jgi:phosphoserine aminotransferase